MEIFTKVMQGQEQKIMQEPAAGRDNGGMSFTSFRAAVSLIAIHKDMTETAVVQMVSGCSLDELCW